MKKADRERNSMTIELKRKIGLSACTLHILAMAFMLCDHMWATLFPYIDLLTQIGRVAFPIFAFMIVEGYFHTSNIKRYLLRLLICALVSEIPFDLMYGGTWFYPFHQNVIWTFLMALLIIIAIEKVKARGKLWLTILTSASLCILGFVVGYLTMVDYYGVGVLTVLTFYFLRKRKWWCFIGQAAILYYLFAKMLGGLYFDLVIFGHTFEIVQDGLAVFALLPIWLYSGRQGYHKKWFQYFCYGFYPGHIIILYVIWQALI